MTIRFKKDANWKRFLQALNSERFGAAARENVRQATGKIAHNIQGRIRKKIVGQKFTKNAQLTLAIKGGKTGPLVDTARRIFEAIAVDVQDWNRAFVGVKMQEGIYSLAVTLHDGKAIKVTDRMMWMFWFLWQKSIGRNVTLTGRAKELWDRMPGGWRRLKASTTVIKIPSRRFIDVVVDDPRTMQMARRFWRDAMIRTFQQVAR